METEVYWEKTDTVGTKRDPKKFHPSNSSIGENTFFSSNMMAKTEAYFCEGKELEGRQGADRRYQLRMGNGEPARERGLT